MDPTRGARQCPGLRERRRGIGRPRASRAETLGQAQSPRLNLHRAEAPVEPWHELSVLAERGETPRVVELYGSSTIQLARKLTVAKYMSCGSERCEGGENVAMFRTGAAWREPTRRTVPPSSPRSTLSRRAIGLHGFSSNVYHAALVKQAVSRVQHSALQPAGDMLKVNILAAPLSLDCPVLETAERSLEEESPMSAPARTWGGCRSSSTPCYGPPSASTPLHLPLRSHPLRSSQHLSQLAELRLFSTQARVAPLLGHGSFNSHRTPVSHPLMRSATSCACSSRC